MSHTKNIKKGAGLVLGLVMFGVLAGCSQGSDRTINLADKDIKMGTPVQVQPPGTTIDSFSQDGQYYAVSTPSGMEVRSYEGKTLYHGDSKDVSPLMFTNGGSRLVCLTESLDGNVVKANYTSLDWASGQVRDLGIGLDSQGEPRDARYLHSAGCDKNDEQTILFAGTHAILVTGAVVPLPKDTEFFGFAPDGVMILTKGNAYVGLWPDGTVRPRQKPIDGDNTTTLRNHQFQLSKEDVNMDHERSHAFVSGLWLSHSQAKADQDKRGSALVGAGFDFKNFGFVPGHDAVWFSADDGSFVVPFTYEKPSE